MAIELITGYAGAAHISSADDGAFNIGAFGAGKYVFESANKLAASVVSANLISIASGDALFEGRHVRLSSAETVAIENGAQGVNRNDIICIKYERASETNVETATLAVIKGTAAATATDPTIPSGSIAAGASTAYMPLYRVPIHGITVNTPVRLFDYITSVSDISGTVPITRGGTGATTAAAALKNIMGGKVVLYNNASGTTGTVTLSQSAANFNHMRVYATSPYGDTSCDVINPNGKDFTLWASSTDNASITRAYMLQQRRTISGTSITVYDNGYIWLESDLGSNRISSVSTNTNIAITRVEAWNE